MFLEICVSFLNSFLVAENDSEHSMQKSQILRLQGLCKTHCNEFHDQKEKNGLGD